MSVGAKTVSGPGPASWLVSPAFVEEPRELGEFRVGCDRLEHGGRRCRGLRCRPTSGSIWRSASTALTRGTMRRLFACEPSTTYRQHAAAGLGEEGLHPGLAGERALEGLGVEVARLEEPRHPVAGEERLPDTPRGRGRTPRRRRRRSRAGRGPRSRSRRCRVASGSWRRARRRGWPRRREPVGRRRRWRPPRRRPDAGRSARPSPRVRQV